jgi:hypothetical protein
MNVVRQDVLIIDNLFVIMYNVLQHYLCTFHKTIVYTNFYITNKMLG